MRLVLVTLLAFLTLGCVSLDYDLSSVPVPISAKPASAEAGTVEDFRIEVRNTLYVHGLFGHEQPDVAALVAERMALPMTYVRKKPKGYGKNARIEGAMSEGERVLLVEDLTTDGGSKLSFVDAIRETGASCANTAVIFYYDIFPETEKTLGDHGVALHYLCTWWDVLAEAKAQGAFSEETLAEVETFLKDPRAWQEARKNG